MFALGGIGGKPSEEKAKQNVFGTPQVFGNFTSQTSSLFGSEGSSSFSRSSSFGSRFSSGTGVAATGFAVSTQQSTGTLGQPPAFKTTPSFGSSTFISSHVFGIASVFGSSLAFVGSSTGPSSSFGSPSTGGFGSFANVQTPTFGQLAQGLPSSAFCGRGSAPASQFGGGFGSAQSTLGCSEGSVFGQPAPSPGFGSSQPQGFGNSPSFDGNPAFSSYRG